MTSRASGRLTDAVRALVLVLLLVATWSAGLEPAAAASGKAEARQRTDATAAAISKLRTAQGLSAVTTDPALVRLARQQADAMARAAIMSHDVGGSFQSRLAAGGVKASRAAENVGAGQRSLDEILRDWMASSGHRDNLMMRDATRIGLARSEGRGGPYWALVLASPEPLPRRSEGQALPGGIGLFIGVPTLTRP